MSPGLGLAVGAWEGVRAGLLTSDGEVLLHRWGFWTSYLVYFSLCGRWDLSR